MNSNNKTETYYHIEQLISSNFVKYNVLSDLVKANFNDSNASFLNIFIDLNSVLKSIYREGVIVTDSVDCLISSSIINMCGHYRKFFSFMGVRTQFFLVFGDNFPRSTQDIFPEYNQKYIQDTVTKKELTRSIAKALKLVNTIVDYIPGVYFFDIGRGEVSSMIVKIIEELNLKNNPTMENMIISKDVIPLQLIPKYKRLKVLRPLKHNGEDKSFIVNHNNLWQKCFEKYMQSTVTNTLGVNEEFFTNILAMTRVPDRSMYKVFNTDMALKLIRDCIDRGLLKEKTLYMQSTVNNAIRNLDGGATRFNTTLLENRWSIINPFFQYKYILPLEYHGNLILKDLDDVKSLKELVLTFYDEKNPIMLDSLY